MRPGSGRDILGLAIPGYRPAESRDPADIPGNVEPVFAGDALLGRLLFVAVSALFSSQQILGEASCYARRQWIEL